MTDTTREEVVYIFNEAKSAERDERVQFYGQAIELVLNKEPALIDEFLTNFLEMTLDQLADVRRTLVGFLEDLLKKYPKYSPKVLDAVLQLADDQAPTVVKRFITAASATIFKVLLEQISSETVLLEHRQMMWQVLSHLLGAFTKRIADPTTNEGVRHALVKLLETVILSFTLPDSGTAKADYQKQMARSLLPNILSLSTTHPVLPRTELKKMADLALDALVTLLQSNPAPTTLMIVLNSLAAVAKVRSAFSTQKILPALLSLAKSIATTASSASAAAAASGSTQHTLKTVLLGFLRVKALEATDWPDRIADALCAAPFNAREQIEQLRKHGEYLNLKRPAPVSTATSVPAAPAVEEPSKRPRVEPTPAPSTTPPGGAAAAAAAVPPTSTSPIVYPELNTVQWDAIADIVIATLTAANIPPTPHSNVLDIVLQRVAAISQPFVTTVVVAAPVAAPAPVPKQRDPRRDPRLAARATDTPMPDATHTAPVTAEIQQPAMTPEQLAAAYNLYWQQMAALAILQANQHAILQQPVAAAAAAPAAAPTSMETTPTAPSTEAPASAVAPPAPPSLTLSTETADRLAQRAFVRILEGERAAHFAGKADQRALLLARLAVHRAEDDSILVKLRDHILADLPHRMDLLLDWMFEEFRRNDAETAVDEKKQSPGSTRYARVLLGVLKWIIDGMGPEDTTSVPLFIQLLQEVPRIPQEVIDLLKQLCDEADTRELGFHTLRHLVVTRPLDRNILLNLLLEYTLSNTEAVRNAAVTLIARKLFAPNGERMDKASAPDSEALRRAKKADRKDLEDHRRLKNAARAQLVPLLSAFAVRSLNSLLPASSSAATGAVKQPEEERGEAEEEMAAISNIEAPPAGPADGATAAPTENRSSSLTAQEVDVNRHMHLFFELCIRDHRLLQPLAELYTKAPRDLKTFIRAKTPDLIRPLQRSTSQIIALLQNTPRGAEGFVLHMLHAYCNQALPPPALVAVVRQQFKRSGDVRVMVPVLPALPRDEIVDLLPKLVSALPPPAVKAVIVRLSTPPCSPPPLPANDLLSALHLMQQPSAPKENHQIPLKRITEATQYCLDLRNVFKQEVLAIVLQQLVDVVPLPALFMRTVIHTANKFPKLIKSGFIPNILSNLVRKQVWQQTTLWEGFIRCCKQIAPFSFTAVIMLPRVQLEELLRGVPEVREDLGKYVHTNSKTMPKATQQTVLDAIANVAAARAAAGSSGPSSSSSSSEIKS